jgi:hypothetical protein
LAGIDKGKYYLQDIGKRYLQGILAGIDSGKYFLHTLNREP